MSALTMSSSLIRQCPLDGINQQPRLHLRGQLFQLHFAPHRHDISFSKGSVVMIGSADLLQFISVQVCGEGCFASEKKSLQPTFCFLTLVKNHCFVGIFKTLFKGKNCAVLEKPFFKMQYYKLVLVTYHLSYVCKGFEAV